jgi:hypothetical protein
VIEKKTLQIPTACTHTNRRISADSALLWHITYLLHSAPVLSASASAFRFQLPAADWLPAWCSTFLPSSSSSLRRRMMLDEEWRENCWDWDETQERLNSQMLCKQASLELPGIQQIPAFSAGEKCELRETDDRIASHSHRHNVICICICYGLFVRVANIYAYQYVCIYSHALQDQDHESRTNKK